MRVILKEDFVKIPEGGKSNFSVIPVGIFLSNLFFTF